MPDPEIRKDFGGCNVHHRTLLTFFCREDIFVRQHQQEIAQIVRCSTQPILEAEHEAARVLRLLNGQIFENSGQRVQELEHGVLETGAASFLSLFHEASNRALALSELSHREAAELVKAHHLRHRGKDNRGFETIAMGGDGVDNLLSQIFDENQRGDEHIGLGHIVFEVFVVGVVAKFFDQVAAEFDTQVASAGVQSGGRLRECVLVLGLQHHIHRLHDGLMVLTLHRSHAAIGGADLCEHRRTLSCVTNFTATSSSTPRFSRGVTTRSVHRL